MSKVFIVVEQIDYEGETIIRAFSNYAKALDYIKELEKEDAGSSFFPTYDIREKEVY